MFEAYAERVAGLEMTPLRVEVDLADSVVTYDGLHFDAILSYAVVEEVTRGAMLPPQSPYIEIPLPLAVLWRNRNNVPLYASTDLMPSGSSVSAVRYWHKRGLEPDMSHRSIRLGKGKHKERRVPMPTINAQTLAADVMGNAEEIARLLNAISTIGKKRNSAGAVLRWRIYEITRFQLVDNAGVARRPIPAMYYLERGNVLTLGGGQHIAFSPPYWHPATRDMCIPTGVSV